MITHREPSEEPRRLSRDGNDVGVSSNSGPNGGFTAGRSASRITISVVCVGGGEGKEEVWGS